MGQKVLTELCSVLGQMCIDEDTRKECDSHQVIIHFIQIYEQASRLPDNRKPGSNLPAMTTKILSKVSFALKQLCQESKDNKLQVGQKIMHSLVADLMNPANLNNKDWATNSILLLQLLCVRKNNCIIIKNEEWKILFKELQACKLGTMDVMRDTIGHLQDRVSRITNYQAG